MRLGVKAGKGCGILLDSKMQDLGCRYLQFDEIWGFIGKKERHVRVDDDPEMGDVGAEVDYGQIVKVYTHDAAHYPERHYSAPSFASAMRRPITGNPDMELVYIERLNATTRLHMRRLTRLTLAFSKKLENFEAAVALHFVYYNFVKRHNSLRCTPAMAAGVERDFWTVGDLVEATV
jgi:hypothetical protein